MSKVLASCICRLTISSIFIPITMNAMMFGVKNQGYWQFIKSFICFVLCIPFILILLLKETHEDIKKK